MNFKLLFYTFFMFFCFEAGAQTHTMGNQIDTTCSGTFYDAGGTRNYGNNQNFTHTFYPEQGSGNRLTINFSSFDTESGLDRLTVYNGNNTSAPVIGTYSGNGLPPVLTSTASDGSLTFSFRSDGSSVRSGWEANFSCCNVANTGIASSTGSNVCSGENFNLKMSNYCGDLQWQVSMDNVNWVNIGTINPLPNISVSQRKTSYYRGILTLNGTTDTSNIITVTTDCYEIGLSNNDTTCSGTFYDAGGTRNYGNNQNFTHTFYPEQGSGNRLTINFSSFNTESGLDRLTVYNGNNTSAPVIGTYSGNGLPPVLTSTASDGSLTFSFRSDGSSVRSGWEANFSCCNVANTGIASSTGSNVCSGENFNLKMSNYCGDLQWQVSTDNVNWVNIGTINPLPNISVSQRKTSYYRGILTLNGTTDTSNIITVTTDCYEIGLSNNDTTCSGTFYDAGGTRNYGNNQNFTHTFYPEQGSGNRLTINFSSFNTESGLDRLTVYNGNNTSAPVIGTYSGNGLPPVLTSTASNGSLTFSFRSDGSSVRSGWEANFSCCNVANTGIASSTGSNVCSGENFNLKMSNYCGDLQWQVSTDNINWVNIGTINPLPNISVSQRKTSYYRGILTLNGTTDTSNIITVTTDCYEIGLSNNDTTCSGTFYDAGGTRNYGNNQNFTHTFYPEILGNKVNIRFSSFNTESSLDRLTVYNGNSTSAPVIGTYSGNSLPPVLTSTASDGSLTFSFRSDGSSVRSGWEATLSCVCDTSQTIPVVHAPIASICVNTAPFTLTGGLPTGGVYTGTGVVNGTDFDPSLAGLGTFALTYTYTSPSGCIGDTTVNITVQSNYNTTTTAAICQGNIYNWNGSTYTAQGLYADTLVATTGCDSIVNLNLVVNPLPVVQLSSLDTVYCDTVTAVSLIGAPLGGTFTGSGITGTQFDPSAVALGVVTITYSYTNNSGCVNTATATTRISDCNVIGVQTLPTELLQLYPNPSNGWVTIKQTTPAELLIEVFAENGQLVFQKTTSEDKVQVSLQEQPNGVYFFRVTTATDSYYNKVILIK